jgi:alanine dehydrogenase
VGQDKSLGVKLPSLEEFKMLDETDMLIAHTQLLRSGQQPNKLTKRKVENSLSQLSKNEISEMYRNLYR